MSDTPLGEKDREDVLRRVNRLIEEAARSRGDLKQQPAENELASRKMEHRHVVHQRFCSYCGRELTPRSSFCDRCGKRTEGPQ